jgi:murein DD-endopeptidase MepM/ murein hydrolase activator NlpD
VRRALAAATITITLALASTSILAEPSSLGPTALPREDPPAPWKARAHERARTMPLDGLALVDQRRWPEEPSTPAPVEQPELARALQQLCGPGLLRRRAESYARMLIEHGETFGVDPFLLAAVAYRQSGCSPTPRDGHRGGLIVLHWKEHAPFVKQKTYRYFVLKSGGWVERERELSKFRFDALNLRRSEPSVYFAAALMSIYQEQCPDIDSRFGSVAHRHPVSHLVWGDSVPDAGSEERLLTDRRRLVEYYLKHEPAPVGELGELKLYSPLDGAPRKITNGLGDLRDGGRHHHRGVDFESYTGEPVRAAADGVVFFAGVQHQRGPSLSVDPELADRIPRSRMGVGGKFVILEHAGEITSAYMHLDRFVVRAKQTVRGGQIIGHVGRSGIKSGPAHLHFELRQRRRAIDPGFALGDAVFLRDATYLGKAIHAAQPQAWRKARYRRWLERHAARR